jgi:selenocysteine lyase/cysteine desulfurase
MDWLAVRANYPGLKRATNLNSCSMGTPSEATLAALGHYTDQWVALGASAWYELWLGEVADWRKNVAKLIGCKAKEVAWTPSVSAALASLSGALDRHNRDGHGRFANRHEVIVGDLEFPTALSTFSVRPKTSIRWAKSPDGTNIPAATYAAAMGPDTQAIVASRVFYTTGAVQPVAEIQLAAKKAGALCIIDDYQATGQLPLDVGKLGLDVAVGGSLKWLCGGVASGWMFVRSSLIKDLEPTHAGWWANAGMFDFQPDTFRFWDDARRFEGGELNLPSLFTSNAAIKDLLKIGPARAAERTQHLARDLVERLEAAGLPLRIHPDPALRSAIVMVKARQPEKAVARLAKQGIIVDNRPGCVRLSPHFYNTEAEGELVVDRLQAALA